MLSHGTALRFFNTRKRPDRHLGIKLRTQYWLRPIGTDFELICVWATRDEKGKKNPRELWETRHVALITPDYIEIKDLTHISSTALGYFFQMRSQIPRSNAIEGREFFGPNGASIVTPFPVRFRTKEGCFERLVPQRVRHTDPEKKKELDALIKEARRKFRARAKLGVFKTINPDAVLHSRYGNTEYYFQLENPEALLFVLRTVSQDGDVETFKLLYQMLYDSNRYYIRKALENYDIEGLITRFDQKIANARNRLNEFYGAKYYA